MACVWLIDTGEMVALSKARLLTGRVDGWVTGGDCLHGRQRSWRE